jgi:hypothetical protein
MPYYRTLNDSPENFRLIKKRGSHDGHRVFLFPAWQGHRSVLALADKLV